MDAANPQLLVKHGGYRKLKSFQMAQLAYDITVVFCDRFVEKKSRTHDQMTQAARSGVQNIAEGSQASATSKKTEIKLTGVARASLEELALDYEDYLRHRNLPQWPRNHPALEELRQCRPRNLAEFKTWVNDEELQKRAATEMAQRQPTGQSGQSGQSASSPSSPSSPSSLPVRPPRIDERVANGVLLIIGVACFCLDRQLQSLGVAFTEEGGFTERLYRIRQERRIKNNSPSKETIMHSASPHTTFFSLLAAIVLSSTALAATNYVWLASPTPTPPYTSWNTAAQDIQSAINAATNGDLVLVTNGIYVSTGNGPVAYGTNVIAVTRAVTVRSVEGAFATFIDGGFPAFTNRCVYLSTNAVLDGFTLRNGAAVPGGTVPSGCGGGVLCTTNGTMLNSVVTACQADTGGGSFCLRGGIISNCYIWFNTAIVDGGGVGIRMGGLVCDSQVRYNHAVSFGGGAAIENGGDIQGCVIEYNSASNVAGGARIYAKGEISNCVVNANQVHLGGSGGIFLMYGGTAVDSRICSNAVYESAGGVRVMDGGTVLRCRIEDNSAELTRGGLSIERIGIAQQCIVNGNRATNSSDGGIGCEYGGILLNCLVYANQARTRGGGIALYGNGCMVESCTIAGNAAANEGGGLYCDLTGTVVNSIVYGNTATNQPDCAASGLGSIQISHSCTPTLFTAFPGNITNDPEFMNPAMDNYRFLPTSPCFNAGTNTAWAHAGKDMDGVPRLIFAAVDMGAYELLTGAYVRVTPSSIDFGTLMAGEFAVRTAVVDNIGGDTISGYVTNVTPPFSVIEGADYYLYDGAVTTTVFRFNPPTEGVFSNTVLFVGSGGTPVLLTGAAIPEPATVVAMAVLAMLLRRKN